MPRYEARRSPEGPKKGLDLVTPLTFDRQARGALKCSCNSYERFLSTTLAVLVNRCSRILQSDEKSKHRDVLYVCAGYPYILLLFVCLLVLPSLVYFSILSNCFVFFILVL